MERSFVLKGWSLPGVYCITYLRCVARVIKQIVLKLESIQSVPLKMNDPFGTLLASFWCDIVEAYTVSQGGHELQQKRFFHLWKEDYDAQFPDKLVGIWK